MMKGGLYIKKGYTSDTAFRHFIENSNISYLSKGTYGIILKCTLNEKIESPYTNLRTIYKDKAVRMIIIKISFINDYNDVIVFTSEPVVPLQQLLDQQQQLRVQQLRVQEEQQFQVKLKLHYQEEQKIKQQLKQLPYGLILKQKIDLEDKKTDMLNKRRMLARKKYIQKQQK